MCSQILMNIASLAEGERIMADRAQELHDKHEVANAVISGPEGSGVRDGHSDVTVVCPEFDCAPAQ